MGTEMKGLLLKASVCDEETPHAEKKNLEEL